MSKTRKRGFKKTVEMLDLSSVSPEDKNIVIRNAIKTQALNSQIPGKMTVLDSIDTRTPAPEVETNDQPADTSTQSETPGAVQNNVETSDDLETSDESDEPVNPEVKLSLAEVEQLVTKALAPVTQEIQTLRTENNNLTSQLEEANKAVQESSGNTVVLEELGKLIGKSVKPDDMQRSTNLNTTTSVDGNPTGILKDFMDVRAMSNVMFATTTKGWNVPSYDTRAIDTFCIDNRLYDPSSPQFRQVMKDLTAYGKKHGLFRGDSRITEEQARSATTASNIPGGFLEILSSMMRVSARPGLVFWQFARTVHEFQKNYGQLIDVPRARYPDTAQSSADRLLSGSGTYTSISENNASVQTGIVQLILKEYGRGRPDSPPIAIPTFVSAYSMISLLPIMQRDLWFDYYNWEDVSIREIWRPTSPVFYNNGNTLVSTAAEVNTVGTCTRKFLGQLYVWFANRRVVPMPDGNYGLVINPTAVNQLKDDLDTLWNPPTAEDIAAFTNMMLLSYPNGENLKLTGYVGLYQGFHIFQTNSFASGDVGEEGVFSETDGTSETSTFREGYAFGDATAGRVIGGSGAQIVYDEKSDFGRSERAIWLTYQGFGPLDVDNVGYNDNSEVPQEQRVARVRFSDTAVA